MKIVYYSANYQFELTDEEFESFIEKSETAKKVWIPRLQVFLSDMFIWAGEKPENPNKMRLHDGCVAVRKFGKWVDQYSGTSLDPHYYPELAKDVAPKQLKKAQN